VIEPRDLQPVRVGIDNVTFREFEQGLRVTPIIHRGTAPGTALSSYAIHLPPGHVGKAHLHRYGDVIVVERRDLDVVRVSAVDGAGDESS
jgi:hypothetical protein